MADQIDTKAINLYNKSKHCILNHYDAKFLSLWGIHKLRYILANYQCDNEEPFECYSNVINHTMFIMLFNSIRNCSCCDQHTIEHSVSIDTYDCNDSPNDVSLSNCNSLNKLSTETAGTIYPKICRCKCRYRLYDLHKAYMHKYRPHHLNEDDFDYNHI